MVDPCYRHIVLSNEIYVRSCLIKEQKVKFIVSQFRRHFSKFSDTAGNVVVSEFIDDLDKLISDLGSTKSEAILPQEEYSSEKIPSKRYFKLYFNLIKNMLLNVFKNFVIICLKTSQLHTVLYILYRK